MTEEERLIYLEQKRLAEEEIRKKKEEMLTQFLKVLKTFYTFKINAFFVTERIKWSWQTKTYSIKRIPLFAYTTVLEESWTFIDVRLKVLTLWPAFVMTS